MSTTTTFTHLLRSPKDVLSLGDGDFITRLHEPFPWITFLSDDGKQKFADEVVAIARGCASVGHFGRLGVTIAAWEATATALAQRP